jgi:hypothetical protein
VIVGSSRSETVRLVHDSARFAGASCDCSCTLLQSGELYFFIAIKELANQYEAAQSTRLPATGSTGIMRSLTPLLSLCVIWIARVIASQVSKPYNNPIIPGFAPDPSCISVDNRFFCVTSSFSAFPGIPVYTSTDLVQWEQIGNVVSRPEQLPNLAEISSSTGGMWAATIRQVRPLSEWLLDPPKLLYLINPGITKEHFMSPRHSSRIIRQ